MSIKSPSKRDDLPSELSGLRNESRDGTVDVVEDSDLERLKKAVRDQSRRPSVTAKPIHDDEIHNYIKPVHPKDDGAVARISKAIVESDSMQVLIGHCSPERVRDVVNAFYLQEFADGSEIIRQDEEGDGMYILDEGQVDIYVARPHLGPAQKECRGGKVDTWCAGKVFGELALMYSAPRAATVVAVTQVKVWRIDARDFRMLFIQSGVNQCATYEGWLREITLLKNLNHYELSKLVDVLEMEFFDKGDEIMKQGDVGDKFYILEDGACAAYMDGPGGEVLVKTYETQGDYFGEVALLTDAPRKATVRAIGKGCCLATLSRGNFVSLLGTVTDVLRDAVTQYPSYDQFVT